MQCLRAKVSESISGEQRGSITSSEGYAPARDWGVRADDFFSDHITAVDIRLIRDNCERCCTYLRVACHVVARRDEAGGPTSERWVNVRCARGN